MAIYFPPAQQSADQLTGQGFGTGIGQALQELAQSRMQQLQQRQQQGQLGSALQSLGVPAQVGALPEKLQQAFIKQHLAAPQQQAFADALSHLLGGQSSEAGAALPQQQETATTSTGMPSTKGLNAQQAMQIAQLGLKKQALAGKEASEQRKQAFQEAKEAKRQSLIEERESNKQAKEYYDKVLTEAEGAKKGDMRLNRMQHLIEKGSLPYSTTYKLFKDLSEAKFGTALPLVGPIAGLIVNPVLHAIGETGQAIQKNITSRDTEEFEKLQNDFVRDAKTIFGARITNQDLNVFLSMIPTLLQSDNGKKAVIRNMKSFNEAARIKSEVMKKIIKENGGKKPTDLAIRVEDEASPLLDRIAKNFTAGLPIA